MHLFAALAAGAACLAAAQPSGGADPADPSADIAPLMEAFHAWLAENGATLSPKAALKHIPSFGGIGVEALEPIAAGEVVVEVPLPVMMTSDSALASDLGPALEDFGDMVGPTNRMALHLMHEALKGDSFWKPYIDQLPRSFDSTLYLTPEELDELQASDLKEWAAKRSDTVERHYYAIVVPLIQEYPDLLSEERYTLEMFKWALSIVWSRSFSISWDDGRIPGLVPLADSFNNRNPPQVDGYTKGAGDAQRFVHEVREDVAAGEQLYVQYSKEPANARLMMDYGYVLPDNPHDQAFLHLDNSDINHPRAPEIIPLLQRMNLFGRYMFPLSLGEIPLDLLMVLRIRALDAHDLANTDPLLHGRAVGPRNERAALGALIQLCEERLAEYATTVAEDQALLDADDFATNRLRSVVIIRRNEKRILHSVMELATAQRAAFEEAPKKRRGVHRHK